MCARNATHSTMDTTYCMKSLPHCLPTVKHSSSIPRCLVAITRSTTHQLWKHARLAFITAATLCLPIRSFALQRMRHRKLDPEQHQMSCGHFFLPALSCGQDTSQTRSYKVRRHALCRRSYHNLACQQLAGGAVLTFGQLPSG